MKTKTIEIEIQPGAWSLSDHNTIAQLTAAIDVSDHDVSWRNLPGKQLPLKITFEIPVPEPTVSITPSMIDEIFKEYQDQPGHVGYRSFLKSRLFPKLDAK